MKSQWIASLPTNTSNKSELIQKIYELITWYEENSTRKEDDYIKANLKLVVHLAESVENSEDIMFIEKIADTFCDIIRKQREIIQEFESVGEFHPVEMTPQHAYMASYSEPVGEFVNDEQIKSVFVAYMQKEGKSAFTANDYILRIQNLWRSFYADHVAEELPKELDEVIAEEEISAENPLLNAYNYIEELNCYVSMKLAGSDANRNWANVRAALNRFGDAMHGEDFKKSKSERKTTIVKDFSKYSFYGQVFGKSRLVLAVVKKYVEDHQPTTFDELKDAFPDALQGSLGVVRRIGDVSDKYKGIGGVKRYFVDDVIRLMSGERVIVCTQWAAVNTEKFVENAMYVLGYEISKIES